MAKGPHAFRTISEAADELGVPQHVLRFWETRFSFIRPMKRAGGRRFYRPQDIAVLAGVRALLHGEGYTIKGVQQLHKEQGLRRIIGVPAEEGELEPELELADELHADPEDTSLPFDPEDAPEEAVQVEPDAQSPPPVATPSKSVRSGLRPDARHRLNRALDDLTQVQARLDALLPGSPGEA